MHCSVSGCGDVLAYSEEEAISYAKSYLTYFPQNYQEKPKAQKLKEPKADKGFSRTNSGELQNVPFDIYEAIDTLIDEGASLK